MEVCGQQESKLIEFDFGGLSYRIQVNVDPNDSDNL
jgi:hypothetical protein